MGRKGRMYVTGRRGRGRPPKVYIFSIRINRRVDWAMSVFLSVCLNASISESIRAWDFKFGM